MSHLRQQIRERAAATVTGLVTTGANVFKSRLYPLEPGETPGILVYTDSEVSEIDNFGAVRDITRNLELKLKGFAQATSNIENDLDKISKEIEVAMGGDVDLNSLAIDSFLSATEIEFNADGNKPVGAVTLTYNVIYRNAENNPEVAT